MKHQVKRGFLVLAAVLLIFSCFAGGAGAEKKQSAKGKNAAITEVTTEKGKTEAAAETKAEKRGSKKTAQGGAASKKAAAPKKISISGSGTVQKGKTVTLKAKVSPSGAAQTVTWSSSNKKVATVSKKGVVTGKKAGTAEITATSTADKKVKATFTITVASPTRKITLSAPSATLALAKSMTIQAETTPADASREFTWKSSNSKVATVNDQGVVTAIKAGKATITATAKDGTGKKGTIKIKVVAKSEPLTAKIWVAGNAVELTKKQIEDFNASNKAGITIDAKVEAISEAEAATMMLVDVESGADIYCFAQDQFARLLKAGALDKMSAEAQKTVSKDNDAGSVAAATSGKNLYAYPLTSDNGFFLYYDKSIISDEDADSLEQIIADCEATDKYFAFEMQTSAWYMSSFFTGTGCKSEWITDDEGNFVAVDDDYNSEKGLTAVKGMKKLVDSSCHVSAGNVGQFEQGAAAVVSGTWDYEAAQEILGDNMGVTDLPSFEVDGKKYHLGSFSGCKLMGVKPQADDARTEGLNQLAQYLTGEQAQMERFEALSWGPSNKADQASEAVQANAGLAAMLKQAQYSVPQGQIHGAWWDIAKDIAGEVKDAKNEADLQAALDHYSEKLSEVIPKK